MAACNCPILHLAVVIGLPSRAFNLRAGDGVCTYLARTQCFASEMIAKTDRANMLLACTCAKTDHYNMWLACR